MNLRLILGAVALSLAAPVAALPQGDEPIAVPRSIKQGIDFVYVDPDLSNVARRQQRDALGPQADEAVAAAERLGYRRLQHVG